MSWLKIKKILLSLGLVLLLFTTSCNSKPPSRFEQAQQESTQRGSSAVVNESETGGSFNKFFPSDGNNYQKVYTQEKKGFAQAKLKKSGQEVAMMAISDLRNNPNARTKFANSTNKIAGYPAVQVGKSQTAILVGENFQVSIRSLNESFTVSDRQAWLAKFDLNGLAQLK